uniref:Uncharacterized protein n=1 Tax=Meloidogyne enterolobii TaxID=390850 RepID=A0A6V7WJY4_MELEN|nr:unnamed protein product [Meloidogyne enterolobii]
MHLNYNHFFFFTLLLITIFMLITVPYPVESFNIVEKHKILTILIETNERLFKSKKLQDIFFQ